MHLSVCTSLIVLSGACNIIALYIFLEFYNHVNRNCFLFCRIDIFHRTLTEQSPSSCIAAVVFSVLSLGLKTIIIGIAAQRKSNLAVKFLTAVTDLIVCLVILAGVYATCERAMAAGSLISCSREVFTHVDFFTFTPKYMRAFSFPEPFYLSAVLTAVGLTLTLLSTLWKFNSIQSH